jgi:phospholipid transport system substrate-binding protein
MEALAATHGGQPHVRLSAAHATRALNSPTAQVRKCADTLRKTLLRRYPRWSPEADAQAMEVQRVIDETLDFDEIARRTLGPHWNPLSPDQRREFTGVLQKLIERRPFDRSLRIDRESSIAFHPETVGEREAVVHSTVTTVSLGKETRRTVEYRLCLHEDRWRVYDIVVNGVSLVDNYRDQFSKIIARESFEGLLQRMRRKVGEENSAPGSLPGDTFDAPRAAP